MNRRPTELLPTTNKKKKKKKKKAAAAATVKLYADRIIIVVVVVVEEVVVEEEEEWGLKLVKSLISLDDSGTGPCRDFCRVSTVVPDPSQSISLFNPSIL